MTHTHRQTDRQRHSDSSGVDDGRQTARAQSSARRHTVISAALESRMAARRRFRCERSRSRGRSGDIQRVQMRRALFQSAGPTVKATSCWTRLSHRLICSQLSLLWLTLSLVCRRRHLPLRCCLFVVQTAWSCSAPSCAAAIAIRLDSPPPPAPDAQRAQAALFRRAMWSCSTATRWLRCTSRGRMRGHACLSGTRRDVDLCWSRAAAAAAAAAAAKTRIRTSRSDSSMNAWCRGSWRQRQQRRRPPRSNANKLQSSSAAAQAAAPAAAVAAAAVVHPMASGPCLPALPLRA